MNLRLKKSRAKNIYVGTEHFNQNKFSTSKGDPEYSGRKKPKRTFPFELRLKFPVFDHNSKHREQNRKYDAQRSILDERLLMTNNVAGRFVKTDQWMF